MPRTKVQVRELARSAGLGSDEVIGRLRALNINVANDTDYVPKSKASLARRALGIDPGQSADSTAHLAAMTSLSEQELRDRLANAGIHLKRSTRRLRKDVLRRAELALGLRSSSTDSEPAINNESAIQESSPQAPEAIGPSRKQRPRARDRAERWPLIGRREDMAYLDATEIEGIHELLVEDFRRGRDPIEPPGVRDETLLGAAAFRPHTSIGQELKYPSVAMAGAALFHALVHDHAFHNGNKRTALVSLLVFLDKNGYVLPIEQDILYDYVLQLAQHRILPDDEQDGQASDREVIEVARWLQRNMRKVSRQERRLKWHQLRSILNKYYCTSEVVPGNRINIERAGRRIQVGYRDEGTEVEPNTIKKIRVAFELDEAHGYDSDIFYNAEAAVDEFVNKYRRTLDRLAKV
jgi:death-on-curing family protein